MALGSALWGQLAASSGMTNAFLIAAIAALAAIPTSRRWGVLGACS
jgi:hypothetical protein